MGKLKFEKTFSEKLKSRAIEPKAGSWEQLSIRLDSSKSSKKNPTIWWIGIAATIIGGILIFGSFFNEPVSNNPGIVDIPIESSVEEENKLQKNYSEEEKQEEIVFEEKEEVIKTSGSEKTLKVSEEQKPSLKNRSTVAAIDKSIKVQEPDLIVTGVKGAVPEITPSIEDAIAEVVQQEKSGNFTEAEVDALLAKAAAEISQTKNGEFSSENIDARSLLREVEFEMEESFRDKVFEVLKEGYLKARTAVANRNY